MSNVRKFIQAWALYAQDNNDELVGSISQPRNNTWYGGQWLQLPINDADEIDPYSGSNPLSNAKLWPYTGENPAIWRCPEDLSVGSHPDYQNGKLAPRVRSYSMNIWVNGAVYTSSYKLYENLSDLVDPGPAETFIFLDQRADNIADGSFVVDMRGFNLDQSDSNRTAFLRAYPANYHNNGAVISFGDGHVELHTWTDTRTTPPLDFENLEPLPYPIASPNNSDVYWLQYHSTRLEP